MSDDPPLLNPRRINGTARDQTRSAKLSVLEQRFYTAAPRFEEAVKRVCERSVVMFRSDTGESMVRGLEDLERDYDAARKDSMASGHSVTELEGRYGAAIVLVHLHLLAKVNDLDELAETGTQVTDIRRLASNLGPICQKLAEIEATASVATTGDLTEEDRLRLKSYTVDRVARVADAIQLRREAQAALKRHHESVAGNDVDLKGRAEARAREIRTAIAKLRAEAELGREYSLDRVLKQVDQMLNPIIP